MTLPPSPPAAKILAAISLALLSGVGSLQANLADPGFETPVISKGSYSIVDQSQLQGWKTTASDHKIEIWSSGFNGVSAFEGNQFAEINANMQATLYQDVAASAAGLQVTFGLAHRGRAATESMRFTITDLGADGIYGTADDSVLFSKIYADGTGHWDYYTSATEAQILTKGNAMRVAFESLTPGSIGNFLDGVSFSTVPVTIVPEPGTWAALLLLCFGTCGGSILRRMGIRAKG